LNEALALHNNKVAHAAIFADGMIAVVLTDRKLGVLFRTNLVKPIAQVMKSHTPARVIPPQWERKQLGFLPTNLECSPEALQERLQWFRDHYCKEAFEPANGQEITWYKVKVIYSHHDDHQAA
jgi:hypothetical protein